MKFPSSFSSLIAFFLPAIAILLSAGPACRNGQSPPATTGPDTTRPASASHKEDASIPGGFSEQHTLHFDKAALPAFLKKYPAFNTLEKDLTKFYTDRQFAYAWFDKQGMIEQASNLFSRVVNMDEEGVTKKPPYLDSLQQLFNEYTDNRARPDPQLELMLTAQYFNYARVVWGGISEKQTQAIDWFLPRKKMDVQVLLDSLLKDKSGAIIQNGYVYNQYGLLKNFLRRLKEIEANKDWPVIKPAKKAYAPGDSASAIADIRKRLYQLGDLSENSGSMIFDKPLQDALIHFQHSMGLSSTDGTAGPATIQALNKPLNYYITKILVNMERCRWVPIISDSIYLVVNIPAFRLYVFQKDSVLFTMKVVVGKAVNKTVIFNGNLQYVVFSPYWNVPKGILNKEVLPGIRRSGNYLAKHNMEWSGNTVRQRPGPDNPLGGVKFLFPNKYDIYLHDSPAKSLFNASNRAFSHGCIRLEDARKLAIFLLRNDPVWSPGNIDSAMKAGKEKWVTLKAPVPVFISYLTAWVDKGGGLNTRRDIYNRDDRLAGTLFNTDNKVQKK